MKRDARRSFQAWAALAALATVSALATLPRAQPPDQAAAARDAEVVLLLRNGQVLQGAVTIDDDRYQVLVPGGEIRVKRAEVLACCRDLLEAYDYKRNLARQDNLQDRLDLSQWCHQAGLLDEAAGELAAAKALDPTHPLIPVLERRLKMAADQPKGGEAAGKTGARGPTSHELDLMVRGMPPRTVEMFAQTIQPMLMNNCAAAGCHGQSSTNGLHLLRAPPGAPPSRRLTQRNLYAALGCIDRSHPAASPLLTVPMRPHGTARAPIFTDQQLGQYRQLVEWCYRVSQAEEPVRHASYEEAVGPFPNDARPARLLPQPPAAKEKPAGEPLSKSPPTDAGARPGTVKRGATAPKFTPVDPFDAEAFNRRFAPPAATPAEGKERSWQPPADKPAGDDAQVDPPSPPRLKRTAGLPPPFGDAPRPAQPEDPPLPERHGSGL